MANTVVLKRSAVPNKIPTTSDLALGELALNTNDGNLFFKRDASGTQSIISVAALSNNNTWSGANQFNGITTVDITRFKNSNTQKFSQIYNGGADSGAQGNTYFQNNEYQPVFTITPTGSAQNYQVVGRIVVQSGGNSQIIYLQAALRSNTLPDLSWSISYSEEIIGGVRYVDPVLWANETSGEAAFTLALNGLNIVYGTVTCDIDVIHRASSTFGAMVMNTTNPSEVTEIPTNFTSYAFTKNFNVNSDVFFGSNKIWHAGNGGASSGLDADLLDGLQGSSYTTLTGTQTLTNKTLTSPTINSGTANNLTLTGSLTAGGSSGAAGQVLASTGAGGVQWVTKDVSTLNSLTDVIISSPSNDQVLKFNGAVWVNGDVDVATASAVFAANAESDLGLVTDLIIGLQEDLGFVIDVPATFIYNMGSLVVDGIVSLNNLDQSVKADYIAYSIIFGF
jgi:hypothetical protein